MRNSRTTSRFYSEHSGINMGFTFSSPIKSEDRGSFSAKSVIETPLTPFLPNSISGGSELQPAKKLNVADHQAILLYIVGRPGCKMNRHWGKQLSSRLKQLKDTGIFELTNPKIVCILRPPLPDKWHIIKNFTQYVDAEMYVDSNIFDVLGESYGNICSVFTAETIKYYNACSDVEGDNNIYSECILSCTAVLSPDKVLYFRREEFFGDVPPWHEISDVLTNYELTIRQKINKEEEKECYSS